jgi:hypothetical protein
MSPISPIFFTSQSIEQEDEQAGEHLNSFEDEDDDEHEDDKDAER